MVLRDKRLSDLKGKKKIDGDKMYVNKIDWKTPVWNIVMNGANRSDLVALAIAKARVSVHKHRSLTNMPRIPASCSLIGWECLGAGLLGEWMGDQTGLLSAERRTERVDRDGWIEEKMKERVWSESGRGQAQERPVLVYQRIPRFFPFFAFFISLTPAQYKSFFFCVCVKI